MILAHLPKIPSTLFAILLSSISAHVVFAQQPTMQDICDECVVEKFATCGGFLEGASVARDGALWVVDLLSGNVLTVEGNGQCVVQGNTGGQPNGAKFHRDGRLFIADKARGILAFNPLDKSIAPVVSSYRSEALRGVNDLVFDMEGGLYFTEPYGSNTLNPNGRVFYLPPNGGALRVVTDKVAFPNGVALSADGARVYVSEYANKRLLSMPSQLSQDIFDVPFVFANFEGGIGPDGFALDREGNVYAAVFQSGQVQVVSARGFAIGSLALPNDAGTFVTNLAFRDGYLYITEATQGVIWRVKANNEGLALFHQTIPAQ